LGVGREEVLEGALKEVSTEALEEASTEELKEPWGEAGGGTLEDL
jgi:hypothetical protein